MKHVSKIAGIAAVAALSGSFIGAAQAAAPAVDATFYVSGASAARKIPPAIAQAFCSDSPVEYQDNGNGKNFKGVICTYQNAAPVPTALRGKKVAVWTRALGGSLFGVIPVADPQQIDYLDPATCPNDDGNPATTQVCTGLTTAQSDVGISDEDGAFTCAASQGECSTAVLNGLNSSTYKQNAVYGLVWTIQAGENFPLDNISAAAASAVFSGAYTTVAQVENAVVGSSTSTENLKVCRRTNTSGTQAGHRHLWTGIAYCGDKTPLGFVGDSGDINPGSATAYSVINNASSGNLEGCLTDLPTNSDTRAIGINSLANSPGAGAGFKNLKIDGIEATIENAVTGTYPWYHESTAQFNTATQVTNAASTAAEKAAFANFFVQQAADPSVIAAAGIDGVMGLALNGGQTNPVNPANPVAWHSKFLGAGGNNCRAPLLIFGG